jgi:heme exporter protein D
MNVNTILWVAAAGSSVAVVAQWVFLRSRYLKGITQQRTRHQQTQQATHQQLEQAKRQIGHLQHELSLSKQQIARLAVKVPSPAVARARPVAVPHRQRDDAAETRRSLPVDGFADTLPTPQFPYDAALPQQH